MRIKETGNAVKHLDFSSSFVVCKRKDVCGSQGSDDFQSKTKTGDYGFTRTDSLPACHSFFFLQKFLSTREFELAHCMQQASVPSNGRHRLISRLCYLFVANLLYAAVYSCLKDWLALCEWHDCFWHKGQVTVPVLSKGEQTYLNTVNISANLTFQAWQRSQMRVKARAIIYGTFSKRTEHLCRCGPDQMMPMDVEHSQNDLWAHQNDFIMVKDGVESKLQAQKCGLRSLS